MKRFSFPRITRRSSVAARSTPVTTDRHAFATAMDLPSGCLELQLHLEPDQVRALERVHRAWHERDGFGGDELPHTGRVVLTLLRLALEHEDPEATRSVVHVGPVS